MNISERQASMIDYPQVDLPRDIWVKDRNGDYHMHRPVKDMINSLSLQLMNENFNNVRDWYEGILIGSSIASQFYTPDTDIDVKMVIDVPSFQRNNPEYANMGREELVEALIGVVKKYKDKYDYNGHPMDFFFIPMDKINTDVFLAHFDSLYNMTLNTWMVKPKHVNIKDYDRDKVVREGEEMAIEWAEKWDLDIGRIQRSIADFEQISTYLNGLPEDEKTRFEAKVKTMADNLADEIDELSEDREEVKLKRREAYEKYEDDIDSYYGYINALPDVIQMKMLVHWGYLKIIKEISDIGDQISARSL